MAPGLLCAHAAFQYEDVFHHPVNRVRNLVTWLVVLGQQDGEVRFDGAQQINVMRSLRALSVFSAA